MRYFNALVLLEQNFQLVYDNLKIIAYGSYINYVTQFFIALDPTPSLLNNVS